MTVRYMAFLRGINVGGNHLVRMDKLKQVYFFEQFYREDAWSFGDNAQYHKDQ